MSILPTIADTSLVTFKILSNGSPLPDTAMVTSIDIRREINKIPRAVITFLDGNASAQSFDLSSSKELIPGAKIEVQLGYSSKEETVFKGIITRHRIAIGDNGETRLVIEASDAVYVMAQGRMSRTFVDTTDSDAMSTLILNYSGLSADVTSTTSVQPQLVQFQVSDWDFLIMLAETNAMDVVVIDSKVTVSPPSTLGVSNGKASFGESIISANIELVADEQLNAIETGGWDQANQELITGESSDADLKTPGDLSGSDLVADGKTGLRHGGNLDQGHVDQWALAEMTLQRRAAIRGTISIFGSAALIPGGLIDLEGLGKRFSGAATISAIRHRVNDGQWLTDVHIGSSPRAHAEKYQVARQTTPGSQPPVTGLQIATIAALEGDPAGEDRIQVSLMSVTETEGLLWARQLVLDAGDGRGTCFRPEISDEVIVGFLDGDTRDPVILGAVHSSAKPSPITGSDDNHEKAIVTRSGMRLHFDDDKIVTTLDTPNNNSIVLSEDEGAITITDENGNTVTLSSDGIALDSASDVTIKAAGDVKIEATNIELKANSEVKAEGSTSATLKSSGQTVVKGSVVQIN